METALQDLLRTQQDAIAKTEALQRQLRQKLRLDGNENVDGTEDISGRTPGLSTGG